jgi:hypothetical protein
MPGHERSPRLSYGPQGQRSSRVVAALAVVSCGDRPTHHPHARHAADGRAAVVVTARDVRGLGYGRSATRRVSLSRRHASLGRTMNLPDEPVARRRYQLSYPGSYPDLMSPITGLSRVSRTTGQ